MRSGLWVDIINKESVSSCLYCTKKVRVPKVCSDEEWVLLSLFSLCHTHPQSGQHLCPLVQMSKVTTPLELYPLGKKLQIIGKSKKQKTTKTEKVKKNSII